MKSLSCLTAYCLFAGCTVFGQAPSSSDLWNYDRGMYVVRSSLLSTSNGKETGYNVLDMFGGSFGIYPGETDRVVFTEGVPEDQIYFVEWNTVSPVTIKSVRLFAADEVPSGARGFSTFTLKAKTLGSTVFDRLLIFFVPSHPFKYLDSRSHLVLSTNIQPITSMEFRAEFAAYITPNPAKGPRILELDGFGDTFPVFTSTNATQISIRPAVEITFPTAENQLYLLQWSPQLSPTNWSNLGFPQMGNGLPNSSLDAAHDEKRFYRVLSIAP